MPELAADVTKMLNDGRANGFRPPKATRSKHSEDAVFKAVDELAKAGALISWYAVSRHLGLADGSIYQRARQNPEFGERLKAKLASVNGHAK